MLTKEELKALDPYCCNCSDYGNVIKCNKLKIKRKKAFEKYSDSREKCFRLYGEYVENKNKMEASFEKYSLQKIDMKNKGNIFDRYAKKVKELEGDK